MIEIKLKSSKKNKTWTYYYIWKKDYVSMTFHPLGLSFEVANSFSKLFDLKIIKIYIFWKESTTFKKLIWCYSRKQRKGWQCSIKLSNNIGLSLWCISHSCTDAV